MTLYGISNCDTVRRARAWLESKHIPYTFHDFKKHGVDDAALIQWSTQVGWERLVNRRGTTWRKVSPAQQAAVVDAGTAVALMLAMPSLIKRPVLACGAKLIVGFDEAAYTALVAEGTRAPGHLTGQPIDGT